MIYLKASTKEQVSAIKPIFVSNCAKTAITFIDKALMSVNYTLVSSSSSSEQKKAFDDGATRLSTAYT